MELRLVSFHRILIGFAIALGAILLVYGIEQYARTHDRLALATGAGGALACALMLLYLRWFQRKQRPRL